MPLPILSKALFPNVPDLPGVPKLPRSPRFPPTAVQPLAILQDIFAFSNSVVPVWGVFNDTGELAIQADSVIDFAFTNDQRVSSFPVQEGEFATYNAVANPYESVIRVTKGGHPADRTTFMLQVENALASLTLYTVITPERAYRNAKLQRYETIRKREQGATLITVDLFFIEVRQVAVQYTTTATANAKEPAAVPLTTVRAPATPIPAAQESGLSKIVGGVSNDLSSVFQSVWSSAKGIFD